MKTVVMQFIAKVIAALLVSLAFSSCAVEVGNPHPDKGPKKAQVDLDLRTSGEFQYESIDLNVKAYSLISTEEVANTISFSNSTDFILTPDSLGRKLDLLTSSTSKQGRYSQVRLVFESPDIGIVKINGRELPLSLPDNRRTLDVDREFDLKLGEKTRIVLLFDLGKLIQENKASNGELVSYVVSATKLESEVANEPITEEQEETASEPDSEFRFYRLLVKAVNKDRQAFIRDLHFSMNGDWAENTISDSQGTIGNVGVTVSESSYDDNDRGWKALTSGNKWKSAKVFNDGLPANGVGEYIQFEFAQPVEIDGYEFRGDGGDNCAAVYEMQQSSDAQTWTVISGSEGTLEACSLVNFQW